MAYSLISQLLSASLRGCVLSLIAPGVLWLFRVRSSSARHAMWSVVVIGMLLQAALVTSAPGIRLEVLGGATVPEPQAALKSQQISASPGRATSRSGGKSAHATRRISIAGILTVAYIGVFLLLVARMAFGLWSLRRLLHGAKPLPELGRVFFESEAIVIPSSIGYFRGKILLPADWREWDASKLKAVIAHETAHTKRKDWVICLISRVNVCIYWFHPLAWWMEREIRNLAEEACDDIALCEIEDRYAYAATLLEFARTAATARGRLNWGAVSMSKESNVARRLNRIMNVPARAAKPLGRAAWVALFTCSMPLIYLSAAVKLVPGHRSAAGPMRIDVHHQSSETARAFSTRKSPRVLIAQAAPNQAVPPAPAPAPSKRVSLPVAMCILIDTSGSMLSRKNQVQAAALALVNSARPGDEACIVAFDDEAWLRADLTSDLDKARDALTLVDSHGGSAMRDAIKLALGLLAGKAHNKKILVLITDGDDTSSVASEEETRAAIRNSGVITYAVALLNEDETGKAAESKRILTQLATLSGGLYYQPERPDEIGSIASAIAHNMREK